MSKAMAAAKVSQAGPPDGYRPCVGLMVIGPDGRLLMGKRLGPRPDAWQMPQGGIDAGETPLEAAHRELLEEVGTDRVELLAESRCWYAYDLPPDLIPDRWGQRYRGQSQKWFAFRFTGTDADIDLHAHRAEFACWRWMTPEETLRLIVSFKRPVYQAVLAEFRGLLR
jgi:putative (di)nucleoside polyphosphate hydrolase